MRYVRMLGQKLWPLLKGTLIGAVLYAGVCLVAIAIRFDAAGSRLDPQKVMIAATGMGAAIGGACGFVYAALAPFRKGSELGYYVSWIIMYLVGVAMLFLSEILIGDRLFGSEDEGMRVLVRALWERPELLGILLVFSAAYAVFLSRQFRDW